MHKVTPVILCGGSGTRLWPLSRKSHPKQFASLLGGESLFQACAQRVSDTQNHFECSPPIVVTHSDFRFVVAEQLTAVGIDPGPVLIEPEGRNTGPAIFAAALQAHSDNPDALLLVMPSDHVIPDSVAFAAAVARGFSAAVEGQLVTFGITPDQPETGYGYLELNSVPNEDHSPQALKSFVEKPSLETAKRMLESGRYLWNAGIFLFTAESIIEAFERCAPEVCVPVRQAFEAAHSDLGFLRLDPTFWAKVPDISIDYAVMEHSDSLAVVPFTKSWSDLGSWEAVLREMPTDSDGVGLRGPSTAIDCSYTLLRSENPDIRLVGLGLKDMIVVATSDAILVAPTSRAQDVKQVVDTLKEIGAPQATTFSDI